MIMTVSRKGRYRSRLDWRSLNSFSLDGWNVEVNIELVLLSFTSEDSRGRKSILLQAKCVEEKPSVRFEADLPGTFDKLHTLTWTVKKFSSLRLGHREHSFNLLHSWAVEEYGFRLLMHNLKLKSENFADCIYSLPEIPKADCMLMQNMQSLLLQRKGILQLHSDRSRRQVFLTLNQVCGSELVCVLRVPLHRRHRRPPSPQVRRNAFSEEET